MDQNQPSSADNTDSEQELTRHEWCQKQWRRSAAKALHEQRKQVARETIRRYYPDGIDWKAAQNDARAGHMEDIEGQNSKLFTVANGERKRSQHSSAYRSFLRIGYWKPVITPLCYFVIMICYAFIGGGIYYYIENTEEIDRAHMSQKVHGESVEKAAAELITMLNTTQGVNLAGNSTDLVRAFLMGYHQEAGLSPSNHSSFTFLGSTWFAITVFTTIGYGNYAPNTVSGRVFTIFYALIGIPLLLMTLNELGKLFTWLVKKLYNRIMIQCQKVRSHVHSTKAKAASRVSSNRLPTEENDKGHPHPPSCDASDVTSIYSKAEWTEFDFPVPIAIVLAIVWIVVVSYLTTLCEPFDMVTSIYFWFITFTTIGLGDFVPHNASTQFMFLPILFVGLALVSMVITLLQSKVEQVEDIVLEDYLGWETESAYSSDEEEEEGKNLNDRPAMLGDKGPDKGSKTVVAGPTGGFTLGIFHAAGGSHISAERKSLADRTLNLWNKRVPGIGALGRSKSPTGAQQPRPLPPNISKILEMQKAVKAVPRVRRGVQTDESFLSAQTHNHVCC